jgi:hypothetical protein
LRSGDGGFSGGIFVLNGAMPYRDFYMPTPPLFLLRSAAVLAVFGKTMLAIRAAGIAERLVLALLLYGWLVRFFRARNAALATIVTMVVSTGDLADPLSSYNHFTILLAMASGLVSSYALDEKRTWRALAALGCAAGVFASLCLACKQSIGLAITVAIPIVMAACLVRLEGARKTVAYLGGYAAGWASTLALLCAWLVRVGILQTFLEQIFVTGPAAKGLHPHEFLARTLYVMSFMKWEAAIGVSALLLCWGPIRRAGMKEGAAEEPGLASLHGVLGVLLLGAGAIGLSLKLPKIVLELLLGMEPIQVAVDAMQVMKPFIYMALLGSGVLLAFCSWNFLGKSFSRRQSQLLLFAAVSFSIAFMLALSFPAFEAITFPCLGLLLAALLEDFSGWRRWTVFALCGLLLFLGIRVKTFCPFEFAAWSEPPVALATQTSVLPELKGMRLPASTVNFVDNTVRIIEENSSPDDTIFVYPELGFLYGASHRMPATFSASHNIDVAPDSFAGQEAARLLARPPAVLIYGPEPDRFMVGQEKLWRSGRRSGQRDLIAAVLELKSHYKLAATFELYGHTVYVCVRPRTEGRAASR